MDNLQTPLFETLNKELASLKEARRNWEEQWQDIGDLMSPNRGDFVAPVRALTRFSSAMHNLLTPSAQHWFELQLRNRELGKERDVQLWLEEVTRALMDAFTRPNNNFHPSMHE